MGALSSLEHEPMNQFVAWLKVNSSGNFADAAGSQATSSGCVRMFMEGDGSFVKNPL